jgi:lactate permease
MFQQVLSPVADSLSLSFLVAILPVVAVLILLGIFRRPAWQAALAGLIVGLVIAIAVWQMPPAHAFMRSVRALWPLLLVAGGSFAASQFLSSNFLDYALTDVLSSLGSLICTLLFLQVWTPALDPEFTITDAGLRGERMAGSVAPWQGWLPWLIVSVLVILWTHFTVASIGQQNIPWPGLHNAISITLYSNKPYAAVWVSQLLGTGTAILVSAIITALVVRLSPGAFFGCAAQTARQAWLAVVTVMLIIGLAYLMNYSGLAYTLGQAVASTGHLFVFLSPFLGWVAVLLSGSDTSGNALFGNLQVVAARQLNLNPVLFAATNSSGGVMGKMISPQNVATGVSVTNLKGHEGVVFARTFTHSIVLTLLLGVLVAAQQFLIPWIIPTVGGPQ